MGTRPTLANFMCVLRQDNRGWQHAYQDMTILYVVCYTSTRVRVCVVIPCILDASLHFRCTWAHQQGLINMEERSYTGKGILHLSFVVLALILRNRGLTTLSSVVRDLILLLLSISNLTCVLMQY